LIELGDGDGTIVILAEDSRFQSLRRSGSRGSSAGAAARRRCRLLLGGAGHYQIDRFGGEPLAGWCGEVCVTGGTRKGDRRWGGCCGG
jgi:hypothetical protein